MHRYASHHHAPSREHMAHTVTLLHALCTVCVCGRQKTLLATAPPACHGCTAVLTTALTTVLTPLRRIEAKEGKVHVLINNAGTNFSAPFPDYPAEAFSKVLDVNLVALTLTLTLTPTPTLTPAPNPNPNPNPSPRCSTLTPLP